MMGLPQRPDQYQSDTPPALGAGSRSGIIRARLVEIFGTGQNTGLFVYNGAVAKGNLITQIVPPGVTQDPVGDAVSAVLNIGAWSAAGVRLQHFGVDQNGIVYIVGADGVTRVQINNGTGGIGPDIRFFNDFGAVILAVDPSRGGTFQYQDNNSAVQGVLIGAQVGKNTTDPVNGTAVNAGVNLIDPVFGDSLTAVGATINLIQAAFTANAIVVANTGSGATSPFLSLAGPEQGHAGHAVLRVYGVSADGTITSGAIISRTDPPVRASNALLEVQGDVAQLGIATPAAPPAGYSKLFTDTSGFPQMLAGLAGDTNTYQIGQSTFRNTVNQTGLGIGQVTITGLSAALGIGLYRISGVITVTNASVGGQVPAVGISGPALANSRVSCEWYDATAKTFLASGQITAQGTSIGSGGGTAAGDLAYCKFDGILNVSAAGTFNMTAGLASGTTTLTVNAFSYITYTPVN